LEREGFFRNAPVPTWLSHPEIEIVPISDPVKDLAQSIADEHGISHVFMDYFELLALKEVDVVDICTPNRVFFRNRYCCT
jgi:predicted dehydrogenase